MTAMTRPTCAEFIAGIDAMLAREISRIESMTEGAVMAGGSVMEERITVHQNEEPPAGPCLVMALRNLPRSAEGLESWLRGHGYAEAWAIDREVGRVLVVMVDGHGEGGGHGS